VKLSDNPAKTTGGSKEEIDRYLRIFGREGVAEQKVIV
jgi:nicotinate phosphoribosyltransferase